MAEKTRQVEPFDVLKGLDAADGHSIVCLITAIVHCVPKEQLLEMYKFLYNNDRVDDFNGDGWDEVRLTK